MSIRLKLILPCLLSLLAAVALALWSPVLPTAGLAVLAALALVAQWFANERWVMRARHALRAALAGRPAPPVGQEWRELQAGITELQASARHEQAALEQAVAQTRRIEEALQQSEERYVLAIRGANDGLWDWDLAAERVLPSPRWRHMFGLDNAGDAISAAEWHELLHPEDRAGAIEALDAHLGGRSDHFEHAHRLMHADGRYRWVLSRGTALRRGSGTAYRIVGLDTDITKIKRVESVIHAIANGTARQTGDAFFRSLVQHFAQALHLDCAFITECTNRPPSRARTLAFWRGDGFDANFEYELAGTPCDRVIREGRTQFHPNGLAELFPCEAGQKSYLGLPIFARDGRVIGHLAFVDSRPMNTDIVVESVYRIFTARAAVEIELIHALQRLRAASGNALAVA